MKQDFDLEDVLTFEEDEEATVYEEALAIQRAINTGMAWRLQGSYGRAAMEFLESGLCVLPCNGHRDYYGNIVPPRHVLEPGTKGTEELVVENQGQEWLDQLLATEDQLDQAEVISRFEALIGGHNA